MTLNSNTAALLVTLLVSIASGEAIAQYGPETIMNTDWRERHAPDGALGAHDFNLLGDNIDLATGNLSFETVDVSLPGNSHLPVEFRRRLNPGKIKGGDMWDWRQAVPTISINLYIEEWVSGNRWGKNRCTTANLVNEIPDASWPTNYNNDAIPPNQYSNGVILDIPGVINTHVLDKTTSDGWPASADKVTAANWYLECILDIDGQGTEGFVAVAPNGDRYTFDRKVTTGSSSAELEIWTDNENPWYPPHYKKEYVYYDALTVSQITDVDGNWVQYDYHPNGRLKSITANDGRTILICRDSGGTCPDPATGVSISHVIANPGPDQRMWTYTYSVQSVTVYKPPTQFNGWSGTTTENWWTLTGVALPDGRAWQYGLVNLHAKGVPGTQNSHYQACKQYNKTVTVTHPDGVTGSFVINEITLRLGKSTPGGAPYCPNSIHGSNGSSDWSDVMAVTKKTLSAPSIETSVWQYTYVPQNTNWEVETTIIRPDNSNRVVHHPNPFNGTPRVHTRMTAEEIYAPGGSPLLESRTYTYLQEPPAGSSFMNFSTPETSFAPVRSDETTITRGTDWYKTKNTYDTVRSSPTYSYGFPISVDKWSSLGGGTRENDIEYAHDLSNWVLGLPDKVTKNGDVFDEYDYDTSSGRPWQLKHHKRFSDQTNIWRTYAYYTAAEDPYAAGALKSVTDALGRTTTFSGTTTSSGWIRGIPEVVTRNDNATMERTIDVNGWVTSITDWNGNVFGYSYNSVGRLTAINRPAAWTDTTIAYAAPSGGITVQTATRGDYEVTTSFDAMLRPVKVVAQDTNPGGDGIFTYTEFDNMGRVALESLPYGSETANPDGIATQYDALGRKTQVTETATGGGTTSFDYLAGNQTQITDPELNVTTNEFSGYGGPDDGNKLSSTMPEGIYVEYDYDIYGNLSSISQLKSVGGYHVSNFYYDDYYRLCRRHIPETGDTIFAYNPAYEMTGYRGGEPTGTQCVVPQAPPNFPYANGVWLKYDNVGRLEQTLYDDTVTPAISRGYDDNGNVLAVNRGGVNWTYTYNELDLVETESLAIDALPPYLINPEYDGNERLVAKTFPSGNVYAYVPDAHGRTRQVALGSTTYVNIIDYYPNGKIESLTRGNGGTFDQNLNARQLVSYIGSNWGDSFTYMHDANGRIESITASINSAYNRAFDYDGVGRLTVANAASAWGTGSYEYDKLGNLELKTLGGRTVNPVYNTTTNRLVSVDDSAEVGGPRAYGYLDSSGNDNRGNVTSDGNHTFAYDLENQPITISGADSGSYRYDGNLKRVEQDVNNETIYSVYDSAGSILTRINTYTNETTDYLTVAGRTFVRVTNGTPSYPLNDHLGTAFMVAGQSGNILPGQTYNYTPFGETWPYGGNDPGDNNEQGYTGHIEDQTGLTYMQARYYDPVIGRFLQTDPIGYEDGLNVYAYVGNNPVGFVDPLGLCAVEDGELVGCIVNMSPNLTEGQKANAEQFVADLTELGKMIQEEGSEELQQAFSDITELNITGIDNPSNINAAASINTESGILAVWRPGVDSDPSSGFLIQMGGHEIEHMTERDKLNFDAKARQGKIGKDRAEVQTDIRAIGWLQKHGALPSPYKSQSGYTPGRVFTK